MRLTVLIVATLALPPTQGDRSSVTFDLGGYLAELDRLQTAISTAALEDAQALATSLPDRWWVTVDAQVTVVDTRWIDDGVRSAVGNQTRWPAVRSNIVQRLRTMHETASEPKASTAREPADVLQSVLARPEFRQGDTSQWLEKLRNQVGEWLLRTFNRLTGFGGSGRTVALVMAWVLSILTLSALALWLVSMLTRRSQTAALELGTLAPRRAPAREWALRAVAAARAGDLREAIRCGYQASLCRLDEQGAWRLDDARTPREYLPLLATSDPRYPILRELTRQFEQIWYGRRVATADDAQRLTDHLERLGCLHGSERAI